MPWPTGRCPTRPRRWSGQLDRSAVLVADMLSHAERHGLDQWRLMGATLQAAVSALAVLGADDPDPSGLSAHIATMTTFLDTMRRIEFNIYTTFYDAELRRLLNPTGQPDQVPPPRHRTAAGPRHRDVPLRRRTAAAARPHPR